MRLGEPGRMRSGSGGAWPPRTAAATSALTGLAFRPLTLCDFRDVLIEPPQRSGWCEITFVPCMAETGEKTRQTQPGPASQPRRFPRQAEPATFLPGRGGKTG